MSRRERKKLQSRQAILDAAVRQFGSKGFRDTSIADIMNDADLGLGTFYNYFGSKEEILLSLLERLAGEIDTAMEKLRKGSPSALRLLSEGSRITAKFLDENRFVLPLFLSGAQYSSMPEGAMPKLDMVPKFRAVFEEIIRRGQKSGELRDDVPSEIISEMIHSVYQAAAFSRTGLSFQKNIEIKMKILLDGIRLNK